MPNAMSTPPRTGSSPLLTLDEALSRLLDAVGPVGAPDTVSTFDARGRVLAADVSSHLDIPSADNTLDGRLCGALCRRHRAPASCCR